MSLKEEVEVDIKRFFEHMDSQNSIDREETLRNLLDKYVHLTTAEHILSPYDLAMIVGGANTLFKSKSMPTYIGPKLAKTCQSDEIHLCVIESTITVLNSHDCLKKLPKFDYRDNKF